MMTDQHLPLLEATPMLAEVPFLPPVLNGDAMQQMILVQVNPGETFTIRTEDGHFQCITGPAQVPMVSPNGTMPPIFVPPGYVSQVVEENGVRKVLILPHSLEFQPSLGPFPQYGPLYGPPHPALLHHPQLYHADLCPRYVHQLPTFPVYTEQDVMCHNMSVPVCEERSVKVQEQMQRRLKGGYGGGYGGGASASPHVHSGPGPFTKGAQAAVANGLGKGRTGSAPSPTPPRLKHSGRTRSTPPTDCDIKDPEEEVRRVWGLLSTVCKPTVGGVTSHSAVLSWRPPVAVATDGEARSTTCAHTGLLLSYELALSQSGTDGDFTPVYQGKDTTCTVEDLRPATPYYARVCVACSSVKGTPSETAAFTTLCGVPDVPAVPRLVHRTTTSVTLQWRSPNDNGAKITAFHLEYHEGDQSAFKEVYSGLAKQYKVMRLTPSTKYAFRLAAKNDVGMSAFSTVVNCCTVACIASPPAPPSAARLTEAGTTWLSLEWSAACGPTSQDTLSYILEMEDMGGSSCGFQMKHKGEEPSCTVRELRRFTTYRFRVVASSSEGHSQPSVAVEYRTQAEQPGQPGRPVLHGPAEAHRLHAGWEAPEDDGGAPVTAYVLELSHSGDEWDVVYHGPLRQHVCEDLREGTWYKLRVYCRSQGGRSEVSESLSVKTAPLPPGPCQALRVTGGATSSQIPLSWAPPAWDGGAPVSQYCVEMAQSAETSQEQVFQGTETHCTVGQLLPGTTYLFWVKASNSAGWGAPSEMCPASTTPGVPEQCSPPHLVLTTPTSVLATWESPACSGEEECGFVLAWGAGEDALEVLYSGPSTQQEVPDLRPATDYYCRVQAVNAVGAGLFSKVAMITTPASVPAAVERVEQVWGEPLGVATAATSLALRWEEPQCHGAEITGYNIDFGEQLPLCVDRTNFHILENLQPDTTYRIRVGAVNAVGAGPFGSALKLRTAATPPEPPLLECVVAGPQSLKLRWGEGPSRPPNSRNTHYSLHMLAAADRPVCIYSGPCRTFKVQRLCEATAYQFSIQAHGESGPGPLSPPYTFSTTRSPPPQLRALKVEPAEWNKHVVTWETVQPMRGDPVVYALQLLRGREVEQLYKGSATSYTWVAPVGGGACRLRVCAARRAQDGSELWGPWSLVTPVPVAEVPKEAPPPGDCPLPHTERGWLLADEPFATALLLGFVVMAVLFAVLLQYLVIERQ
ncbi:fibronectin type-III domain-containing protein 3a-like isoform X2 [Brachyhypopomus gauderio]|uniref:fibronectin type-III domain-containing protein 3a-like isoform X2 n=1 Tax=Brachyhypopomus gauderio TaxID=698409 RepID=UPI0040429961